MQTAPASKTSSGEPYPLGATVLEGGVNFSLFSEHATSVELLLFRSFADPAPLQVITLHPVGHGQLYAESYGQTVFVSTSPRSSHATSMAVPCRPLHFSGKLNPIPFVIRLKIFDHFVS